MHVRTTTIAILAAIAAAQPAPAQLPAEAPPETAPTTAPAGTITLDMQGAGAEEAFTALAKQADITVGVRDPQLWQNADPVFIKVEHAHFWPTFLDLCRQSRLSFNPDANENRNGFIRLVPEAQGIAISLLKPVEAQGLLLIPRSSQRSTSLSYERTDPATSTCVIQLMALAEPSLLVTQLGPVTVEEAVDENGLSLLPPKGANLPFYAGYMANPGTLAQNLSITLANPKDGGKQLARLKGSVRLTSATQTQLLEIPSPLKAEPLTRQLSDFDLTIQPLTQLSPKPAAPAEGSATYQFKVSLQLKNRPRGGPGLQRAPDRTLWTLTQSISLVDAQGRRYTPGLSNFRVNSDTQEAEVTFRADPRTPVGEPVKLTWKLPLGLRTTSIPFELTDLPLP